jgi:hypothetical protein
VVKETLGVAVCSNILFVHAILGCDTTSRLFGVGKRVGLKKLHNSTHFLQQAEVFHSVHAIKEDVAKAGEQALVCIYNGKPDESLDSLRHKQFCEKVATSTMHIKPHTLPPTSAAAQHHSYRVYWQVQEWRGDGFNLNPNDWGWKVHEGLMVPVMTDMEPAPKALLEIIRCNCKEGCATLRCTCRKHGIDCSAACGNCKGVGCANSPPLTVEEDNDDVED